MSTMQEIEGSDLERDYRAMVAERLAEHGEPLVYSVAEAARLLGISRALAYSLVRQRQLPSIQLGRRLVIPRRALDQFLEVGSATSVTARP